MIEALLLIFVGVPIMIFNQIFAFERSMQAARSGFQTAIALPAGTAGKYVSVQALDASGRVLGTAATATVAGL